MSTPNPFIYFDAGNVLLYKVRTEGENIMADLGLPPDGYEPLITAVVATMGDSGQGYASMRTVEDEAEYLDRFHEVLLKHLGRDADPSTVERLTKYRMVGDMALLPGVVETLQYLQNHKVRVGLLSNAPPSRRTDLRRLAIDQFFDPIIISSEVGMVKPDPAVYELAEERAGVRPEDTVFVDDKEEYLDGARAAGWGRLIQVTSASQGPSRYEAIGSIAELVGRLGNKPLPIA